MHAGCQPEIYQENLELNKRLEKLKNSQKRLVNDLKEIEMHVKRQVQLLPHLKRELLRLRKK